MPTVNIYPSRACTVDQGQPNTNLNQGLMNGYINIGTNNYSPDPPWTYGYCNAWLGFNLSTLPSNISVSSVKFVWYAIMYYQGHSYDGVNFSMHKCTTNSWDKDTITWNNAPNGSLLGTPSGTWYYPQDNNQSDEQPRSNTPLLYTLTPSDIENSRASGEITYRISNDDGQLWGTDYTYVYLEITYTEITSLISLKLFRDGTLSLPNNLNERLPAVTDGLVVHYPLDGKGGAFDIIGGTQTTQNVEANTNLVEAMNLDWRNPNSWSDPSNLGWHEGYQALKITGYHNMWLKTPIVVDPTKTYQVSMEIMEEVQSAIGLYLGGLDNNAAGERVTYNYDYTFAANAQPTTGVWTTYRVSRTGTGTIWSTTSTTFDTVIGWTGDNVSLGDRLTKYYYLGGLFNYNSGGIMYIRNLSIVVVSNDTSNTISTNEGIAIQLPTTNLIPNPTIFNNGWSSYGNGNDGAFITEFGTEGLKLVNRQSWCGAYKGFTPSVSTYTFSVWVKPIGRTSTDIVQALYIAGGGISDTAVYADWSKQGKWQKLILTVTFTSTATAVIYLICYGGANDPAYKVTAQYTMPQIEERSYSTAFVNGSTGQGNIFLPISQYLNNTNGTLHFKHKPYYRTANTIISASIVQNNPPNGLWWGLYRDSSNQTYIHWLDGSTQNSGLVQNLNEWSDYTIKWDVSLEYYYINGSLITTKARSAQNPTNQFPTITLGWGWTSGSGEFKDLSIYNKALIDAEIKALSEEISQIKKTEIVMPLLIETPIIPVDAYYFPLTSNTLDITNSVGAVNNANVGYEDSKIWIGKSTTNTFTYPTFNTAYAEGGWNHWGDTGNIGTYGQNTNRDFILTPTNTYSHWVANGAGATSQYLLYQIPEYPGGYRSIMAMIKMSDGSPVTNAKVFPVCNSWNGGAPTYAWTSIKHIGGGWYRCKWEGFSQDGSNDLVGFFISAGYKCYFDHAQLEDLKPFSSPFVNGIRPLTALEFNFNESIGLSWASDWSICYWKKPQATFDDSFTSYNIESLGCNSNSVGGGYMWWGKENGSDTLAGSTPNAIIPANYFNKFHWISLVKTGTNIVITTRGIDGNLISVRNQSTTDSISNYYVTQYGYDFKLGGWDGNNPMNTYFRDLIVIKRALSTAEQENLYKQMSIYKSKTLVKNIIEQGI